MDSLSDLQRQLARFLQRRSDLVRDPEAVAWAARHLSGGPRLTPVEQLEIYREQYWLRHTSSLVEDFPGLGGILGQKAWERLVEDYLGQHPPDSFSLRDLGASLPEFVAQQRWLEHHDLCIDMARLEWAYIECFDAADASALSAAELQAIPPSAWQSAHLSLHPALRLLRTSYPVAELRLAWKQASESAPPALPAASPRNLVISREIGAIRHDHVTEGAFALLEQFARGRPLVAAVEAVVAAGLVGESELAEKLTGWFRDWASAGWITAVVTDGQPPSTPDTGKVL